MNLIFFTSTYPYPPGEQFIETEILYLAKSNFNKITILPYSAEGEVRHYPDNITVDTFLARNKSVLRYAFKAPFTKLFMKELLVLKNNRKLSFTNLYQVLRSIAQTLRTHESIEKWIERHGKVDVAYAYWNDVTAYAACLAKEKQIIRKVVSRAHGFDLYEERRYNGYMPLKRQFNRSFEKIFLLSNEAKRYIISQYGFEEKCLEISPLGISVPTFMSNVTPVNHLNVVSVSSCVQPKRIDRIIDSMAVFATENPNLNIRWTHIGDGPLRNSLSSDAKIKFSLQKNINFEFRGKLDNQEVFKFYRDNNVDFFINVSEFEGIPVSIMEAMAVGVPAIATDVGGVSDLVNSGNGWLLSPNPTLDEIKSGLYKMLFKSKKSEVRQQVRMKVIKDFNAEINYKIFIDHLENVL